MKKNKYIDRKPWKRGSKIYSYIVDYIDRVREEDRKKYCIPLFKSELLTIRWWSIKDVQSVQEDTKRIGGIDIWIMDEE